MTAFMGKTPKNHGVILGGGRRCDLCEQPIVALKTASLELFPDGSRDPLITHDRCMELARLDGKSYQIGLDRIVDRVSPSWGPHGDCLEGWKSHLALKNWYWSHYDEYLDAAHDLARFLSAKNTRRAKRQIPTRLRTLVLERDEFRCRRCGRQAPTVRLEVDHVVPVADGGETKADNLQTLCEDCNAGKSDRAPTPHDRSGGVH
jgi:5-methylcytosine-specific restriction endonuclease McrA